MDETATPEAKRERIKAISRTIHSIPVEEGGQYRPPRPAPPPPPPPRWRQGVLAGLAVGLLAGWWAGRRG